MGELARYTGTAETTPFIDGWLLGAQVNETVSSLSLTYPNWRRGVYLLIACTVRSDYLYGALYRATTVAEIEEIIVDFSDITSSTAYT